MEHVVPKNMLFIIYSIYFVGGNGRREIYPILIYKFQCSPTIYTCKIIKDPIKGGYTATHANKRILLCNPM